MKKLLLALSCMFICSTGFSQYLLGFSPQGFKKFSLTTGLDTVIVPGIGFYEYQANTTSDMNSRYFCMVKSWATNNEPDTLYTINIATATVTKDTLPRQTFFLPEYHDEKMYGLGPEGLWEYDLATHTRTLITDTINSTSAEQAGFNHTANEYIFMKKGPNQSNNYDTLCRYNITTGTLQRDTIPSTNNCFDYSEGSDKVYTISTQGMAIKGVYVYDYANGTYTLGGQIANTGIMASISAVDPVNNKYYFIEVGNFNTRDTIICYTEGNSSVAKTDITKNSLSNIEFFATVPPTVPTTGVAEVTTQDLFTIYPNPATDILTIETSLRHAEVQVTDINGKIVLTGTTANRSQLSVGELPPGTYIFSIKGEDGNTSSQSFIRK